MHFFYHQTVQIDNDIFDRLALTVHHDVSDSMQG